MKRTRRSPQKFRGDLMEQDAIERGWNRAEVARLTNLSRMTVGRFFDGEFQTPRVAKLLADVLEKPVSRYFARRSKVAA